LELIIIFPLLQSIHNLIKFSQLWDVFICDFVVATKMCQGVIYELYMDLNTKFKFDAFEAYKSLLCAKHDSIIMCWITNLNIGVEHLAFNVDQQHIWAIHFNM
jgi:hypothetical protein